MSETLQKNEAAQASWWLVLLAAVCLAVAVGLDIFGGSGLFTAAISKAAIGLGETSLGLGIIARIVSTFGTKDEGSPSSQLRRQLDQM